jgi:hypothetical protein
MHAQATSIHQTAPLSIPGTDCPHPTIASPGCGETNQQQAQLQAGQRLHDAYLGRTVSDAEILDHVEHCTHLMELAYGRYIATRDLQERADAFGWMRQRDEALQALSPAAKAAREAEILRSIDDGLDYFQSAQALAQGRAS